MSKVPFRRRVSDFFTQGYWEIDFQYTPWYVGLGAEVFIDGAPGWHFDLIGFDIRFLTWRLYVSWVDNN